MPYLILELFWKPICTNAIVHTYRRKIESATKIEFQNNLSEN